MEFKVRLATRKDARALAPRLRESDKREIYRSSGMWPEQALVESVAASDWDMCWAAELDGSVEVIFGVSRLSEQLGGIWMLGSDRIYDAPRDFYKKCQRYLMVMHQRYPALTNFVDVEHTSSHRWLTKLGFERLRVAPYGPEQWPFIQYISEVDNVS